MRKKKISVSSERSVHTHVYLYSAATWAWDQAEGTEEGRFYNCMSSIILSAFCIEAYLNHIGSELLPYWDDDIKKGLSIQSKLKIVCCHVNLVPDFSRRPFQSFKAIVKFRNLLAHAVTEKVSEKSTQPVRDEMRVKYPETWWEKQSNLLVAKRWLSDTESIINAIHNATGKSGMPPLGMLSMGSHSGTLTHQE
ncbi:MAG: hypothetical protein V3U31_02995 [Dehalococcoidia bacterium]